jgi:hypothetical protein
VRLCTHLRLKTSSETLIAVLSARKLLQEFLQEFLLLFTAGTLQQELEFWNSCRNSGIPAGIPFTVSFWDPLAGIPATGIPN